MEMQNLEEMSMMHRSITEKRMPRARQPHLSRRQMKAATRSERGKKKEKD